MKMLVDIMDLPGDRASILTLLDSEADIPPTLSCSSISCCGGSKWTFCLSALRLAKSHKIQTAIVGHVALLPIAWMLKRLGYIQQYVVVLHGIEAWQRLRLLSRLSSRGVAAVIATTHYTAREFCYHNKLGNLKSAIIPLGSTIKAPQGPPEIAGDLRLLTVTRLAVADLYKGVDTVLHAVSRGRELGLNLSLEIVGDGDDRGRLEGIARSLGVQAAVRFRGSVPDVELQKAYAHAHVFVLPSKKEGFGIAFLEAMSSGIPCIGANHGGVPEVITHSESGFLIEYGDVDELVVLLRALMESPTLLSHMSKAALDRAKTLTFGAMAESWRSLLRDLQIRSVRADNIVPADALSALPDRRRTL